MKIIGVFGLFVLIWWLFLALAFGSGSYCKEITSYRVQGATITIYSCTSDGGGHYMMEVTCPDSGGPCRTRTY